MTDAAGRRGRDSGRGEERLGQSGGREGEAETRGGVMKGDAHDKDEER